MEYKSVTRLGVAKFIGSVYLSVLTKASWQHSPFDNLDCSAIAHNEILSCLANRALNVNSGIQGIDNGSRNDSSTRSFTLSLVADRTIAKSPFKYTFEKL